MGCGIRSISDLSRSSARPLFIFAYFLIPRSSASVSSCSRQPSPSLFFRLVFLVLPLFPFSEDSSHLRSPVPSMAAVVESAAVPRAPPGFRRLCCPVTAMALVTSVSCGLRAGPLPECRGLKLSWRPARHAQAAAGAPGARVARRGAVVCEASEAALEVPIVTKSTWQSLVMEADQMVVVAFWAPWCGPCRVIHPLLAEIAAEYSGKLKCYELNTDESPDVATQYGIRSIPTVMFFKNGEKKDAIIGAVPKSTLVASIDKFS